MMVVAYLSPPYDLELEGLGLYKKGSIAICNLEEGHVQGPGLQGQWDVFTGYIAIYSLDISPCDMYEIQPQYAERVLH